MSSKEDLISGRDPLTGAAIRLDRALRVSGHDGVLHAVGVGGNELYVYLRQPSVLVAKTYKEFEGYTVNVRVIGEIRPAAAPVGGPPGMPALPSRDDIYQDVTDRAREHGVASDPDHEVGDLQQAFGIALRHVPDDKLAQVLADIQAEIVTGLEDDEETEKDGDTD